MFVYALKLQDGADLSPVRTGLILLPMALGLLGASLLVARLLVRFGRRALVAGGLIEATGLVGLALALSASWPHPNGFLLIPGMLIVGIGQGLLMSPIFGVVLSDVPAHLAGAGSGVTATMQQGSLALGVATVGRVYLTLAPKIGALHASLIVLAALFVIALVVAALSLRLVRRATPPAVTVTATTTAAPSRPRAAELEPAAA
jgi:MFS family permease